MFRNLARVTVPRFVKASYSSSSSNFGKIINSNYSVLYMFRNMIDVLLIYIWLAGVVTQVIGAVVDVQVLNKLFFKYFYSNVCINII